MNATSLSSNTLTALIGDLAGHADTTEIRGKKGTGDAGTVLYEKTKFSNPFGNKTARAEKQAVAREAVKQALVGEFASSKSGFAGKKQVFLEIVAKDMKAMFDSGPMTLGKVKALKQRVEDMASLASGITKTHDKLAKDPAYVDGSRRARAILTESGRTLPTMEAAIMEYAELAKVEPKSTADKAKLGALKAHMNDMDAGKHDVAENTRARDLLEGAVREMGATHVEVSPQCVALRRMGHEHQQKGLCSALIRLVALEESRVTRPTEQSNRMLERLGGETTRMVDAGRREGTHMATSIEGILGRSEVTTSHSQVVPHRGTVSHKDLVSQLRASPEFAARQPVYFGLQFMGGMNHTIMVGANPGPPENFTFYDPNFGLARFNSAEAMGRFLDGFFEKYGEEYHVPRLPVPSGSPPGTKGAFGLSDIMKFNLAGIEGGIPRSLGGLGAEFRER